MCSNPGLSNPIVGRSNIFTVFDKFKSSDLIQLENPIYFGEELDMDSKTLQNLYIHVIHDLEK